MTDVSIDLLPYSDDEPEAENDPYRITYVGNYCNLFEPTVFYPPRTVYARRSPSRKNERRKQKLPTKTLVFDPRCFKFRFGVVFLTELYSEGTLGFKVRALKYGRKGASYSMTFKVINKRLFWYTWKPANGVRSYITPITALRNWLRSSMLLASDDLAEIDRLFNVITFQMFKLASIAMPWVAEKVEAYRIDNIHYFCWSANPIDLDHHGLGGKFETSLWLGMVYPNLPLHSRVQSYLTSLQKIDPRLRGGAKDICKKICGVSSKRAIELLEHGALLSYERVKDYVTPQQFLDVRWENLVECPILPSVANVPSMYVVKDKGLRTALGRMLIADLNRKEVVSSFATFRDAVLSIERLEVKGFTTENFKKLRKNFKSLTFFDQALGHCVGLIQRDFYEYQHTFRGLVRGVGEVRMPMDSNELMRWGQDMGNCIGGYVGYFTRGHSLLIGLINHEGKCLAAAEICSNTALHLPVNANVLTSRGSTYVYISQCVGRHNKSTPDSVYLHEFIMEMVDQGQITAWGLDTYEFGVGPCFKKTVSKETANDAVVNKTIIELKSRQHG